ncbi:MAG: hypothetical protein F4X56_00750 [Gammaproteobacteria bacterium]|nr:hypothetical protein [Gammaproteobacteria bacterium]
MLKETCKNREDTIFRSISLYFAAFRKKGNHEYEHQNKKPPLPDLPRSVEEKPIVYDDADLEEIREIAALPPIHFSPDEIEFAISTEHADARMREERDDAFQRLHATDQSLLKWYNMRMKEEQQLMKLFVSLKTLEVKLAGAANLKATYTSQEW